MVLAQADVASFVGRRYKILEPLGSGGMGAVYRALDRLTGQQVALKRMLRSGQQSLFDTDKTESELRFMMAQEFRSLASLRHPHIISVLDYGFDEEQQPYFTMSLLENARTILDAGVDEWPETKLRLLEQILQALAYLHRRGIIHRDLKPANVAVVDGVVKLLDFGLAIARGQAKNGDKATTSGTLTYMAPEVLMQVELSEAADLYAVGVLAYELFAGRYPFDTSDVNQLLESILYRMPDLSVPGIDPAIAPILNRLLAKNPHDRYRDAGEVIQAFSQATDQKLSVETEATRESFLQAARLVGRENELGLLMGALKDAAQNKGSLWFVTGESGVGKSRLLEEIRTLAMVQGKVVVRGYGVSDGGKAYQYWRDPLRWLCLYSEINDVEASILTAIVPDIENVLERTIPPAPELDPIGTQARLLAVVESVFRRQAQPLVIILDDMQWADESLVILKRLTHLMDELPIVVFGSYTDDAAQNFTEMYPDANFLRLNRLDENQIVDLSVSMLGEVGRNKDVVDLLKRETEGNVYFLVEVVRTLAEETGALGEIGTITLPDHVFAGGVRQIIERRLSRIEPDERPLLRLAAILGRELDLAVLGAAHVQRAPIDDWLRHCADANVLEVFDDKWRFAHEQLRQGVLRQIEDSEKSLVHQQAAEALEAVYGEGSEYALVLMNHWREAGNIAREVHYSAVVGADALLVSAFPRAKQAYERALELTPESDDDEISARRVWYQFQLAEVLRGTGHYPEAVKQYQSCLAFFRRAGDHKNEADALRNMGILSRQQGDYQEAKRYLGESIIICKQIGYQRGQAIALNSLGLVMQRLGQWDDAQKTLTEALEMYTVIGYRQGISWANYSLGMIAQGQGNYDVARQYYRESLAIAREINDGQGTATALNNLGSLELAQDHYEAARTVLDECLNIFSDIGDRQGAATTLNTIGFVELALTHPDRAYIFFKQGLDVGLAINSMPEVLRALVGFAEIGLRNNETDIPGQWLGFVQSHPACNADVTRYFTPARQHLRDILSEAQTDKLLKQGEKLTLERVLQQVQ